MACSFGIFFAQTTLFDAPLKKVLFLLISDLLYGVLSFTDFSRAVIYHCSRSRNDVTVHFPEVQFRSSSCSKTSCGSLDLIMGTMIF